MHYKTVKGILSAQNGMNLFRGCTHGCIYCDARSACYRMDHDFDDVEVKINAPELLESELRRKRKRCMIGTGAMSDPYIPFEPTLNLTRRVMEIVYEQGFGMTVQTKSDLILRDLDLICKINDRAKFVVQTTLTTADEALCKKVEPNVATTAARVKMLKIMRDNGIPTVVWLSPILPFINDTAENIDAILDYCVDAGVYGIICFGMGMTLREGNREYFYAKLDELFKGVKAKYIRAYGNSYEVPSPNTRALTELFDRRCDDAGILRDNNKIFKYLHEYPSGDKFEQLSFFE